MVVNQLGFLSKYSLKHRALESVVTIYFAEMD